MYRTPSLTMNRAPSFMTAKQLGSGANGPLPVFRLDGKVALITGGGGKIGQECARRLLREGANVCLVDIDADALAKAREKLSSVLQTGQAVRSRIVTVVADACVEEDVDAYTKKCVAAFGRLDCLLLSPGIDYTAHSIFDTTDEEYELVMKTNVKSAFLGLKHGATAMQVLGHGGSIILASSVAALRGTPGYILESSSKSALSGLAATAAAELGQWGIRVNVIHPSGLGSTLRKKAETEDELEEMKQAIPLGRFAQADDIASVVAFLTSEDSKFMTGGELRVDGGFMAAGGELKADDLLSAPPSASQSPAPSSPVGEQPMQS